MGAVQQRQRSATQAAWTFLKWFTSPQQALIWSTQTGDLPIRASETQLPGYDAYVKKYPGVSMFVAERGATR